MIPLFILGKIAAAVLALNEVRKEISTAKTGVQTRTEEVTNMRNSELRDLEQNLQNKNRHQQLKHLYERKDYFKGIADGYFREKQLLFKKLDSTYAQIREINGLKNDLFKSGQHSAVKELKQKTDELYALTEKVKAEFEEFGVQVKGYNNMVQEISSQIRSIRSS